MVFFIYIFMRAVTPDGLITEKIQLQTQLHAVSRTL